MRTFIIGLTVGSQSIIKIDRLLTQQNDPLKYILTCEMSYHHLELLFSCTIRGKNLIEVKCYDLVDKFIGGTSKNTLAKIKEANGGV